MTPDEYLGAVRALAWQAGDYLPEERLTNVRSLIDHGEPAEGLCSLAWVIVTDGVRVPRNVITAIREFTDGIVDEEFMPPDLENFVLPEPAP